MSIPRLNLLTWIGLLVAGLSCSNGLRAQTTIFSETFESVFPGAWSIGDSNQVGTPAYWRDVDVSFGTPYPHTGDWSGYCAGSGYAGSSFAPSYRSSMAAYMRRSVNLAGFTSATLTFWFNIPSIEEDYDYVSVEVDNLEIWSATESTFNWEQVVLNLDAYVGGTHTIAFVFNSDDSVQLEGCYLDDIVLSASGNPQLPNLTPYRPAGWSDKIVVSRSLGATTDSTGLNAGETLYVTWAVINDGVVATPTGFTTELYVDDTLRQSFPRSGSLAVNSYTILSDYSIGSLTAGPHTIRIRTDSTSAVAEINEGDNEYTKNIVVGGTPEIRIAPLTLAFTVTNPPPAAAAAELASSDGDHASLSTEQKLLAASELFGRFDKGEENIRVIASLVPPNGKPAGAAWNSKPALQAWQHSVKLRQDEVLSALDPAELKVRHRFENQSGFSGTVSRKGLEKLARHPKVALIEPSRKLERHLAQGIPLMNAAVFRSSYNGAGVSVAIADSGVDYTHPRLGGAAFPNTKVIGGYDFGNDDADPAPNGDAHGTACAGIAAGDLGTVDDYIGGVAPGAKIYALKITDFTGSAFDDDIIAAWNWCVTHKNDDPANPILVISTSFGSDRYFNPCDTFQTSFATAANNAVAAGVTMLVSSGNNGYCDSIASPACISSIISVGAVFDAAYGNTIFCLDPESCAPKTFSGTCESGWETQQATGPDVVTRYSNTAQFLTLLAPSHRAYTTDIVGSGGYSSGDYATGFGGTSAACPYAAGAIAALQSAAHSILGRYLTPAEVRQKLTSTGDLVADTKAAITTPRVNLGRAIESLGRDRSFTIFNDGNAALNVSSMTLDVASPWLTFTPAAPFSVAPGSSQAVGVSLNPAAAPVGVSMRRLLVVSDDADETPYPGGVFINITNIDTRPRLLATRTADKIVLHWPVDASGFVLQTAAVVSASWQDVSTTPAVVGSEKFITNNITGGARFYRLRK